MTPEERRRLSQGHEPPRRQGHPLTRARRLQLPYHFAESGGPDLRVTLRSGGRVAIESVALVPPTEPDVVLRLP